jgi:hypothetical protein
MFYLAKHLFWDTRRMNNNAPDRVSPTAARDPPATRAGGQDDGSYTNSLKTYSAYFWWLHINIIYVMGYGFLWVLHEVSWSQCFYFQHCEASNGQNSNSFGRRLDGK